MWLDGKSHAYVQRNFKLDATYRIVPSMPCFSIIAVLESGEDLRDARSARCVQIGCKTLVMILSQCGLIIYQGLISTYPSPRVYASISQIIFLRSLSSGISELAYVASHCMARATLVLTKVIVNRLPMMPRPIRSSLIHQFEPMLPCLFIGHQTLRNLTLRVTPNPPMFLLRRNIGCRDNSPMRIDQPQSDEASVSRFGRIL
jgi:hypothetical protein